MGDDTNKETIFNEAVLKMKRIHTTQEIINDLRTNMLAYNPAYLKYNYEVIISNLVSLCYEVCPLMKKNELEEFHLLRKLIDDLLVNRPIYEEINTSNFETAQNKRVINTTNWQTLRGVMLKFEDFARVQVDLHGLSAPKKKDASTASIDL